MKVDVVMCTWNSNKPHFVKCLNSIKREMELLRKLRRFFQARRSNNLMPDLQLAENLGSSLQTLVDKCVDTSKRKRPYFSNK